MKKQDFIALLYQALKSPHGIVVKTNNADVLKQRLYAARNSEKASIGDLLKELKFRTSPTDPIHQLYIVRKPMDKDNAK